MNKLLERYCRLDAVDGFGTPVRTITEIARVEPKVERSLAAWLKDRSGPQRVCLTADARTYKIAGEAAKAALESAGHTCDVEIIPDLADGSTPICDVAAVDKMRAALSALGCTHAVAVGAGTVNDITKMASHMLSLDYSVIGTAPSMNGFTSSIAAVLDGGVKTTRPATAPLGAFADPEVMAAAPARMIASGLGDLYSKPVSNADWRLSSALLGTTHSDIVIEIVDAGSALLEGAYAGLAARDIDAATKLSGALFLSGLGMQAAGTSSPASGGEHLISHYIDMTAFGFGQPHDFHGCQVAVGTMVTSRLYDYVLTHQPSDFDIDALVAKAPDKAALSDRVRRRFGHISDAVLSHALRSYQPAEAIRRRLDKLTSQWNDIFADAKTTLRPADELEAELRAAGCPTRFEELDVEPARAWRAIVHSRDIRARYTILHLADELGLLESFADSLLGGRPPGADTGPEDWG